MAARGDGVWAVHPVAGCAPEVGRSLWVMAEARRRTLKYIDGIGQDALDFDPPGQRYGVATLLYHIAGFEADWLYIDILGGHDDQERGIPECPPDIAARLPHPLLKSGRTYTPVTGEPLEVHVERLQAIRDAFFEVVEAMSVEDFRTPRRSGEGEHHTPEWVVHHLAQHEAEHRGQIWEARVAAETALGGSAGG